MGQERWCGLVILCFENERAQKLFVVHKAHTMPFTQVSTTTNSLTVVTHCTDESINMCAVDGV